MDKRDGIEKPVPASALASGSASLYIGLMSGTSLDAVDAVLVDFSAAPRLLATHSEPMPAVLRDVFSAVTAGKPVVITELGQADNVLGYLFAKACQRLLVKAAVPSAAVAAIGSHGQTVFHAPHLGFTWQLGDPNIIAAITGITTVADFRRRDMALAGQGAPLVPGFHHYLLQSTDVKISCVFVNIGGIANVTAIRADQSIDAITGFDTGPGNALMDLWIAKHQQHLFDRDGEWAVKGTVNASLLEALLSDPYFQQKPPKSTGREYFNEAWLQQHIEQAQCEKLAAVDVQATLAELTATSIVNAVRDFMPRSDTLFVCGGGVHNAYLMQRLAVYAAPMEVKSTAVLGIDPDWLEAMAFAWFAKKTLNKQTSNVPAVTGASQAAILGGVYFA